MYFVFLGIIVAIGSVSAALAYFWYRSAGESDRRMAQRLRQQYLANARLDLLERPLLVKSVGAMPQAEDRTGNEADAEA